MTPGCPRGWISRPLAECGNWVSGGTPSTNNPSYWNGDIPWISAKSLRVFDIEDSEDRVTREGASSGTKLVPAGSVLFVVRGMSLAKEFRVGVTRREVAFNQDLRAIVPNSDVDARYLARYLRRSQQSILSHADNAAHGTRRLPTDVLAAVPVPLPPLSEQKRIAAILDQADTIRRKRRQAVQIVADIAPAVFCAMFPYHGVEQTATLSALGVEFRYGTSNKSEPHGSPTLRIPNVLAAALDLADLKNVPVDRAEFDRLKLRDGDLLFVRTNGNPDYVGRCAVFDSQVVSAAGYDPEHFIYASYLIRGRVDPCVLNPRYLRAFLDTPLGRQMVREQCRTSAGQYNINTHGLGSLTVPLPPIQRQEQFAQHLEKIGELEQNTVAGYADAGRLFDSLLDRAFRGEL